MLRNIEAKRKRTDADLSVLFIDFSSAYDRVDRRSLLQQLRVNRVLNDQQVSLLLYLWRQNSTRLGNAECFTTNGVPQGGTTSPTLFNIFVEPLLKMLNRKNITAYFFADDLIIVGTQEELQQAIATIMEWEGKQHGCE